MEAQAKVEIERRAVVRQDYGHHVSATRAHSNITTGRAVSDPLRPPPHGSFPPSRSGRSPAPSDLGTRHVPCGERGGFFTPECGVV